MTVRTPEDVVRFFLESMALDDADAAPERSASDGITGRRRVRASSEETIRH